MNVAVDTNVFVRLLSGDEETVLILQKAVEAAAARGPLVVSPIVYAELAASRDYRAVDDFFSAKDIEVDWQQGPEVWREVRARSPAAKGRSWPQAYPRGLPGWGACAPCGGCPPHLGHQDLRQLLPGASYRLPLRTSPRNLACQPRPVRRAGIEGPPEWRLVASGRSRPHDEHGWYLHEVLPREWS
jgi:hypothetical protein